MECGTNFRFSAIRGGKPATETILLPSNGDNLDQCLTNIVDGFTRVRDLCPEMPVAISFAFPGPADYPRGIIGDLGNPAGFRGGIALGSMPDKRFRNLFGVTRITGQPRPKDAQHPKARVAGQQIHQP